MIAIRWLGRRLTFLLGILAAVTVAGCSSATDKPTGASASARTTTPSAQTAPRGPYDGLGPADLALARHTVQRALETALSNQTRRWQHAGNGTSGFVTPIRTFKIKTGHYCREYLETVSTAAGLVSEVQIACRDRDEIWKRVEG